MRALTLVALAAALVSSSTCSSPSPCVPGESRACAGPGSCSGFQVCSADGTRFEACDCSAPPGDGGTSSGGDGDGEDGGEPVLRSDAGEFTPLQVPGLVLWLDLRSVEATSGAVTRWADRSPALSHFTPVAAASPPRLGEGSNGRSAPGFASNLQGPLVGAAGVTASFTAGPEWSVLLVARFRNPAGAVESAEPVQWGVGAAGGRHVFLRATSTLAVDYSSGPSTPSRAVTTARTLNDGAFHLIGLRFASGQAELITDLMHESVAMAFTEGDTPNMVLGGTSLAERVMSGVVTEVVAVKGPLSDEHLERLVEFLRKNHGLP